MVLEGGGRVVQLGIPSDVVPNVRRGQGRNRQFTAKEGFALLASCAFNPTTAYLFNITTKIFLA